MMNFIKAILKMLHVTGEDTVESITRPMAQITARLQSYAEAQEVKAKAANEAAAKQAEIASESLKAAGEALALSSKYSQLTIS